MLQDARVRRSYVGPFPGAADYATRRLPVSPIVVGPIVPKDSVATGGSALIIGRSVDRYMIQQLRRPYIAVGVVAALLLLSGCSMLDSSSGPAVEMTVGANETGPFEFDAEAGDTIVVDVQNVEGASSFLTLRNPQDDSLVQEAIVDSMHETFVVQVDGTFSGNFVSRGEGRLTITVE